MFGWAINRAAPIAWNSSRRLSSAIYRLRGIPNRYKCDEIRTSGDSQPLHPDPDVTVGKDEKSNNDGLCDGVTVEKPGLSERAIDQLAREVEDWAYARRDQGDIGPDVLEVEIHRRLVAAGIFPEAVPIEAERVLRSIFEGREAARGPHQDDPHNPKETGHDRFQ